MKIFIKNCVTKIGNYSTQKQIFLSNGKEMFE